MRRAQTLRFVPEARPLIAAAAVGAAVVHYFHGMAWAAPVWLLTTLLAVLFRDPDRVIPAAPLGVVSPADGRVTGIRHAQDPYLVRDARAVTITMGRLGVYVARSPIEGTISGLWPMCGVAGSGSTATDAGGMAIGIRTDESDEVVLVIKGCSRLLPSRAYVHVGERIGQGQRCVFVPFGAELELLLPDGCRIMTGEGAILRAGSDLIGELMHNESGRPRT